MVVLLCLVFGLLQVYSAFTVLFTLEWDEFFVALLLQYNMGQCATMSQPNPNWIEMGVPFEAVGGGRFHRTKIELTFQDIAEWESTKKNGRLIAL